MQITKHNVKYTTYNAKYKTYNVQYEAHKIKYKIIGYMIQNIQYIAQNLQNIWQKQSNQKAQTASFCNPYQQTPEKFLFLIVPFFRTHFLHLFSLLSDPFPLCQHLRISGLNRRMMFVMALSCKIFNIWSYLALFDWWLSFLLFFPLLYFLFPLL